MKEFLNRVPTEGYANRKKITHEDGSVEYVFIENADEPVEPGTPLNRLAFMQMQGMAPCKIIFNDKYIEIQSGDTTQTIYSFNEIGNIFEDFKGEKTISKITSLSYHTIKTVIQGD